MTEPIPGAPAWTMHFLQRVDDMIAVAVETIQADISLVRTEMRELAERVTLQDGRLDRQQKQIDELVSWRRSLTPPDGLPAFRGNGSAPPDEGNAE